MDVEEILSQSLGLSAGGPMDVEEILSQSLGLSAGVPSEAVG